MLNPKLQTALQQELKDGEKVLWSDQPTFSIIRDLVVYLVFFTIIGIVGVGYLFANHILANQTEWASWGLHTKAMLIWGFISLAFISGFSAILLYLNVRNYKHTFYVLTNMRLLALVANGRKKQVTSYWRDNLESVRLDESDKKIGSLSVHYDGVWRSGFGHIRNPRQAGELIVATFNLKENAHNQQKSNRAIEYH